MRWEDPHLNWQHHITQNHLPLKPRWYHQFLKCLYPPEQASITTAAVHSIPCMPWCNTSLLYISLPSHAPFLSRNSNASTSEKPVPASICSCIQCFFAHCENLELVQRCKLIFSQAQLRKKSLKVSEIVATKLDYGGQWQQRHMPMEGWPRG